MTTRKAPAKPKTTWFITLDDLREYGRRTEEELCLSIGDWDAEDESRRSRPVVKVTIEQFYVSTYAMPQLVEADPPKEFE